MQAVHQDIILSNLSTLVEETDLNNLVPALLSRNVFSEEMLNRILNPLHNAKHKKTNLYLEVLRRGPDAFAKLQDALSETGHLNLTKMLKNIETQNSSQMHRSPSLNSVGSNRSLNSTDDNEIDSSGVSIETQLRDVPNQPSRPKYFPKDFQSCASGVFNGSHTQRNFEKKYFQVKEDLSETHTSSPHSSESVKIFHLPEYLQNTMEEILQTVNFIPPDELLNYSNEKYLPVKVKHAKDWIPHIAGKPEMYKMESRPRGCALIIHNYSFNNKEDYPDRLGSDNDEFRLKALLQQLHYEIDIYRNKTKEEMEDIVKAFCRKSELNYVDSSFVAFMSHGGEGDSEEDSEIMGVDGIGFKTKDIVGYFHHDFCRALICKPKIFIFAACRGFLEDPGVVVGKIPLGNRIVTDGKKVSTRQYTVKIRTQSDIFIAYAVPPGKTANRDTITGSWFIQTFVDVVSEHAWNTHLEDLIKKVDEKIKGLNNLVTSNFQTVSTKTIGWNKNLFFNPGLFKDSSNGSTMHFPDPWSNINSDEGMDVVDTILQNSGEDNERNELEDHDNEDKGCFGNYGCRTS